LPGLAFKTNPAVNHKNIADIGDIFLSEFWQVGNL
jgi:hypothetical protein